MAGEAVAAVPGSTNVRLEHHELALGREAGRPPLRLAFGSDFHLGPTTHRDTLVNAFALLREARPDVLLLGGDYVFLGATQARVNELNDLVNSVRADLKIAVLGNHDFWARPARLEVALSAAGTVILVNEALRLPPPHDDVGIAGSTTRSRRSTRETSTHASRRWTRRSRRSPTPGSGSRSVIPRTG